MISAWILTGVGYLVLILVIAVFVWACLRENRDSYDERQRLARGTAARAGLLRGALIFVLLVNGADLAMTVRDAALIRDGMLTGAVDSLMVAATDLAMLIALAAHTIRGRREEKEEA